MPGVPGHGSFALKATDNPARCMNCCFVPTRFLPRSIVFQAQTSINITGSERIDIIRLLSILGCSPALRGNFIFIAY